MKEPLTKADERVVHEINDKTGVTIAWNAGFQAWDSNRKEMERFLYIPVRDMCAVTMSEVTDMDLVHGIDADNGNIILECAYSKSRYV